MVTVTPRPFGPGVQRTDSGSGDPIPTFRIANLSIPKEMRLEPRAAGAFEKMAAELKLSPHMAQRLFDLHAEHVKNLSAIEQRERDAYWHAEHVRYKALPGSAEKIKATQDLLRRYERARGKAAHDAARAALERDAAHHGAVIDFLAYAADPNKNIGGSSRSAARRYGPRQAVARIVEIIATWLGSPEPALALRERADG